MCRETRMRIRTLASPEPGVLRRRARIRAHGNHRSTHGTGWRRAPRGARCDFRARWGQPMRAHSGGSSPSDSAATSGPSPCVRSSDHNAGGPSDLSRSGDRVLKSFGVFEDPSCRISTAAPKKLQTISLWLEKDVQAETPIPPLPRIRGFRGLADVVRRRRNRRRRCPGRQPWPKDLPTGWPTPSQAPPARLRINRNLIVNTASG